MQCNVGIYYCLQIHVSAECGVNIYPPISLTNYLLFVLTVVHFQTRIRAFYTAFLCVYMYAAIKGIGNLIF